MLFKAIKHAFGNAKQCNAQYKKCNFPKMFQNVYKSFCNKALHTVYTYKSPAA